ncbi:MAG: hypothetical protein HC913_03290 [Microscillaceae bacterium]|nr:hypothetical protein [Microscillaceae bacterium]
MNYHRQSKKLLAEFNEASVNLMSVSVPHELFLPTAETIAQAAAKLAPVVASQAKEGSEQKSTLE